MTKEEKRQLPMIIDKVFIEQKINAYTNKRDGWIPESEEYAAYDLVIREYNCIMSQLIPLSTLPDEGEKTDEEIEQLANKYCNNNYDSYADKYVSIPIAKKAFIAGYKTAKTQTL